MLNRQCFTGCALWLLCCCLVPSLTAGSPPCPDPHQSLPAELHGAVARAEGFAAEGQYDSAADFLSDYLRRHPDTHFAYPHYDLGFFRYHAGRIAAAAAPLKTAVDLNPCFAEAWHLLAAVQHETGDFQSAARSITRAARLTGQDDLLYQAAVFHLEAGDPRKAAEILPPLLKKKDSRADWHVAMAKACQNLKQPARAAAAMASAAERSGDGDHRYQAAMLWLEAGEVKQALPLLQDLSERKSPRPEWLIALSDTLRKMNEKVETARAMEKAARISGKSDLLFQAAWLWLDAEHPRKAMPLLETLARKKRVKTDWLLALCNVYVTLERIPEAAAAMDRIISVDEKPAYLYNGGALWLQAEQPGKALPHLRKLTGLPEPEADWFTALSQAWVQLDAIDKAAEAMERAAEISRKPDHAYQAGVLRLQLEQADQALKLLAPLENHPDPKAEWLAALSNAYVLQEAFAKAAPPMERAALISGKPDHYHRASRLWLQAESPGKALPLLQWLADRPEPRGDWLITLSTAHQMLKDLPAAADAMERAAGITRKGEHFHQAAMLRRATGQLDKAAALLRAGIQYEPVEQLWLIDLASIFMELGKNKDAEAVLARSKLNNPRVRPDLRYRGAVLWLNLLQPEPALPILERLCREKNPRYDWLASLIKTHVELGNEDPAESSLNRLLNRWPEKPEAWELAIWVAMQRNDYAEAAAAMEIAIELDPSSRARLAELSDLYRLAGVPVKAAEAFINSLEGEPSPEHLDRVVDILLGGRRYDLALEPARKAAEAAPTAERWVTVGDIAFRLHRFPKSVEAYHRAADLSDSGPIRLKAGYALMKTDDLDRAAEFFQAALDRSENDAPVASEAARNLAYIQKMKKYWLATETEPSDEAELLPPE